MGLLMTDADIFEESRITRQKSAGRVHFSEQDSQMLGRFARVDLKQSAILLAVQKLQLKIQNLIFSPLQVWIWI